MTRRVLGALAALGLAGGTAIALQNQTADPVSTAAPAPTPAPEAAAPAAPAPAPADGSGPAGGRGLAPGPSPVRVATPMPQRTAVIGLLNKRNGLWRDLTLRPGQATRVGDVIVRLRACETTAPWEPQQWTGAFVQLDVRGPNDKWRRVFSGWLYRESPSLNVVEHPIYDVWPKSCAMTHPDTGSATVRASGPRRSGTTPASRSSAPNATPSPAPAPSPAASASPSNAT